MSKLLDGQVSIITGAGRGVGRETALVFAEQGAIVVVVERDEEPGNEVVSAVQQLGAEAVLFLGDVMADSFPQQLIDFVIKTYGKIDILVNNAGFTMDNLVHKMSDDEFRKVLEIHLVTPFRLIRDVAPYMRDVAKKEIEEGVTHYRKIINVSSVAGLRGNVGQANYSSAKAGVVGLTKVVAQEWGQFNINTNAVAFGFMDTRMTAPKEQAEVIDGVQLGIPEKVRQKFIEKVPQKRAGNAREAAEGILFLASPLSNYVNGQVLQINGGSYT